MLKVPSNVVTRAIRNWSNFILVRGLERAGSSRRDT